MFVLYKVQPRCKRDCRNFAADCFNTAVAFTMSATMLSSHSMTPLVAQRLEKDALNNLTDRFAAYLSRVRQMREQSIHMDNINFVNNTKILEDEILSLKTMYERQLEELRNQLEDMGRERSSYQMMSAKNAAQLTDVNQRFDIQIFYVAFLNLRLFKQCNQSI
jgi:hypothetical protein